jgi:hypothetical protein
MTAPEETIFNELRSIRSDIDFIKKHMIDVDMILTKDEEKNLEKSIAEKKSGKTISLEELESDLK